MAKAENQFRTVYLSPMKGENPNRIFLVDRKQVAIIKSYEHTYHVRFVKSGKFMEVKKEYVRSWTPKKSTSKRKPPKQDPQTSLDF